MKKLLVIAGNHEQYLYWVRENGINPLQTIYIDRPDHLRGLEGNAFVFVGNYGLNIVYGSDILSDAIQTQGFYTIPPQNAKEYLDTQFPKIKKPPIGIIPEKVWKEGRFFSLRDIIKRHVDGGFPIDISWVKEYNKLQKELNK